MLRVKPDIYTKGVLTVIAFMLVMIGCPSAKAQIHALGSQTQPSTWTDPSTGLMWTKRDNGSDVMWLQARNYCASLSANRYAGYTGWRLPEIGELAGLYDSSATQRPPGLGYDVHVKGGIQMTGSRAWSATAGNASGEAEDFYFYSGGRFSSPLDDPGSHRALCVRRSGD